jgi:hypothetical protein
MATTHEGLFKRALNVEYREVPMNRREPIQAGDLQRMVKFALQ